MNGQHTPGPWTAGGWSSSGTPIIAKDAMKQHGRIVAMVPCEYRGFVGGMSGNESADYETYTTKANACLIAAAPDLLKACAELIRHFCGSTDKMQPEANQWFRFALDSIAKAKAGNS